MNADGLIQRWRRWRLSRQGLRVDRSCFIDSFVTIGTRGQPATAGTVQIAGECQLGWGLQLQPWGGQITVGHHVFFGPYVVIYGHGGVSIGDHSLISMHCRILSSNHAIPGRAEIIRHHRDELRPTAIGRDVWLGAGVTVLGGVTIGDGCVVGAGAVVSHDLPPYSIAWGVPARVTGQRE